MKSELILSLQAYSFRHYTFAKTLEVAKKLGFTAIETYPGQQIGGGIAGTTDFHKTNGTTLMKLKALIEKSGVKVVSYGVVGGLNNRADWVALMEFCQTLGIKLIQVEAGQSKAFFDQAEEFLTCYDIRAAIHNHRQPAGAPEVVLKELQARGPMLGAGSDLKHWTRAGYDALAGVKLLKGRFFSVHLVDCAPKEYGHRDVPLGSGILDVKALLAELGDQGGRIYVTVEYEVISNSLEVEVAACVRWFRAWERRQISASNRLAIANLAALWAGMKTDTPADWGDAKSLTLAEQTKKMHRLEVDLASVKADKPGANPREEPPMAFSTDPRKKYCQVNWGGYAFVSCALVAAGAPKVYTVSSSDDIHTRTPTAWRLSGSEDGKAWFVLDERKDQSFTISQEMRGYRIAQPRTCKFLKFEVLAQGGDPHMQFSRLGFYD